MASGESKDILMTNRIGEVRRKNSHRLRKDPAGEEGGEGGTVRLGLEQI